MLGDNARTELKHRRLWTQRIKIIKSNFQKLTCTIIHYINKEVGD